MNPLGNYKAQNARNLPAYLYDPPAPKAKPRAPQTHREDDEQKKFFTWCRYNEAKYPCLKFIHSSQSGMKFTSARAGARAKATGMKAGVPDIFLPAKNARYSGLYIELKRPKVAGSSAGRLSEAQGEFLAWANSQGYLGVVCYGADEAINILLDYLKETE